MQVIGLPGHVIRHGRIASRLIAAKTPDIAAAIRRDAVARWRLAMRRGLCADDAARAVGVPRATLYRWEKRAEPRSSRPRRVRAPSWTSALVRAVEQLRRDNPMWGRAKLGPLLRAEGFAVSDATVGRIIARLVARGAVEAVPIARKAAKTRRWSAARRWARRLPKGLKPEAPGDIVQIDTVFVQIAPESHVKHFTAYDPVAKWTVAAVSRRATAAAATTFLDKVVDQMPFPVKAIQVDGGCEFKAEFEQACRARGIVLYELPPKRPQLNGAVERCNSAWRYEFYAVFDLPTRIDELTPFVNAFQHRYNHYRPHGALGGRTPASYLHHPNRTGPPVS
jgi:transposase InsO family protein